MPALPVPSRHHRVEPAPSEKHGAHREARERNRSHQPAFTVMPITPLERLLRWLGSRRRSGAAIAESVTVTGDSPIVDVTRSDVSTSVSTQQIQDLPVASRRWIDLAMLTPGTSQDNIRGQFYRGNVNVGAGGREYSNGFVVDGVNNTWAEMGEPRQNFAMDAIQEFKVSTSTYKAEYGLAEDGLYATVSRTEVLHTTCVPPPGTDTCIAPYAAAFHTHAVQFDPETLTEISKVELGVAQAEPQWVRMKFALAGGGIFAGGPTSAYGVNASVDASTFAAGGNATNLLSDLWAGWNASAPALALGGNVKLAATVWPRTFGTEQGGNDSRLPLVGLFMKGDDVAYPLGHHATIRMTPRDQGLWLQRRPDAFRYQDELGHYYATLGAGPGNNHIRLGDTTTNCTTYNLTNAVSFQSDATDPVADLELLAYRPSDENVIIERLFDLDARYQDELLYCFNPYYINGPFFNSNSYINGLLRAASMPLPLKPSSFGSKYLGWAKPVPSIEFDRNH